MTSRVSDGLVLAYSPAPSVHAPLMKLPYTLGLSIVSSEEGHHSGSGTAVAHRLSHRDAAHHRACARGNGRGRKRDAGARRGRALGGRRRFGGHRRALETDVSRRRAYARRQRPVPGPRPAGIQARGRRAPHQRWRHRPRLGIVTPRRGTMGRLRSWAAAMAAVFLFGGQAMADNFVYVSNAEEGDIGLYLMQSDGTLKPGPRFKAEKLVMPMAVSPDKRWLVAAVRTKPYLAYTYSIHRTSGALQLVSTGPLAESFPYITFDRTSRWLFGASYGANLVSVNPVGADGRIGEPLQVIPTARNAHAIHPDRTNRFVFVPHLGTDQVFQFLFDENTGRLSANTPPVLQLKAGSGPRHLAFTTDNRFAFVLNELSGTVTTLALDAKTGWLSEVSSASILPPESKLQPGAPQPTPGRNVD